MKRLFFLFIYSAAAMEPHQIINIHESTKNIAIILSPEQHNSNEDIESQQKEQDRQTNIKAAWIVGGTTLVAGAIAAIVTIIVKET